VAIAVTATFSQMAFAEALGIDFPLLSDWDGVVASSYGAQYEVWKGHTGLAKRSVFVVGVDGKIAWSWVTDDALVEPDLETAVDALSALGHTGDPAVTGPSTTPVCDI
jgi:peroxiredoxin